MGGQRLHRPIETTGALFDPPEWRDTLRIAAAGDIEMGRCDKVSNEAARDRLTDVLSGLQDQLTDIAAMRKKQAALRLSAQAADGTIEVTVNARGQLIKTVVDKSYLDDHDFEELGDHITEAAQAAAQDAGRQVAEMLAPINERHKALPSISDIVEAGPDPKDFVPPGLDAFLGTRRRQEPSEPSGRGSYDDGGNADFPTVRR